MNATKWILVLGLCIPSAPRATHAQTVASNSNPQASRTTASEQPTVGMEGRLEITLPGTALEARAVEHKARLVVRIADTRPRGDSIWYDIRYIGLVPGPYDLRTNLFRVDGSPTNDLPPLLVTVTPLLSAKHNGELIEPKPSALGRLGGYKIVILAAAILWAVLLIPLLWRHRKKTAPAPLPQREPTFAERLRPLVEQAAAGKLSTDGQAQLERMLLNHWRDRLNLQSLEMAEAIRKLREHPDAGELLRVLETWLHRPPGAVTVDVSTALKRYAQLEPEEPRLSSTNV